MQAVDEVLASLDEGLLWYDDDPMCGLAEKIRRATERYREKRGRYPDVCFVHPAMLSKDVRILWVGGVQVKPGRVPRHHFWLLSCSDGDRKQGPGRLRAEKMKGKRCHTAGGSE